MKIYVPMALAVLIVVSAWGRAVVPAALPPAVHADTETAELPRPRQSGRRTECLFQSYPRPLSPPP